MKIYEIIGLIIFAVGCVGYTIAFIKEQIKND